MKKMDVDYLKSKWKELSDLKKLLVLILIIVLSNNAIVFVLLAGLYLTYWFPKANLWGKILIIFASFNYLSVWGLSGGFGGFATVVFYSIIAYLLRKLLFVHDPGDR